MYILRVEFFIEKKVQSGYNTEFESSSNNRALQIIYRMLKNRLHLEEEERRMLCSRSSRGTLAQIVLALIVTDQRRRAQSKRSPKPVTAPLRFPRSLPAEPPCRVRS